MRLQVAAAVMVCEALERTQTVDCYLRSHLGSP